jgi:hypothetical protein
MPMRRMPHEIHAHEMHVYELHACIRCTPMRYMSTRCISCEMHTLKIHGYETHWGGGVLGKVPYTPLYQIGKIYPESTPLPTLGAC